MKGIRKAIIPAAGFGTRHLPITKAIPKEMLPVLSKPAIDYVVSECIAAGINEICIVISRSKAAIPDYLDHKPELEAALTKAGKRDLLDVVNPFSGKADFYFIRQPEMKGTGNAVRICKEFIAGEDFAVLFPDDIIDSAAPVIGQLITAYETTGTSIVGVQKMPPEQAKLYGIVVPGVTKGRYSVVKGFIEKPSVEFMPSELTSLGRFVLTADVFDYIDRVKAVGGEIRLPDAIDLMSKTTGVYAYEFEGKRYDMGSVEGFLEANIAFAKKDKHLLKIITDELNRG